MKPLIALMGVMSFAAMPVAYGAVSDAQFEQMQQRLDQALQRIDELEEQQQTEAAVQAESETANVESNAQLSEQVAANTARLEKVSWTERFKIKGDFRYRYQNDDIDATTNSDPDSPEFGEFNENGSRNRNRIRARIGVYTELPSDVEVGFALASGSDDPVSANTTLGGAGESKDVFIDMAYFDWSGLENANIRGGKVKNTLEVVGKSQLQWDGDWRPEGLDARWDNGSFFAQALGTYLESDSNKDTEFAYIVQAGARAELGPVKLTGGVGYTDIDAKGKACFYEGDDLAGSQQCLGNQSAPNAGGDETYITDFNVYNVFANVGFDAFGLPINVFADYINNGDADDYEQGYLAGFQVGKVKQAGSWQFKYYYEDIEANSTLALLANSDFGGGGTNGKGSVFSAGYGLTDQANLAATYYLVERNSDNIALINAGDTVDFDTLQLDINFKY